MLTRWLLFQKNANTVHYSQWCLSALCWKQYSRVLTLFKIIESMRILIFSNTNEEQCQACLFGSNLIALIIKCIRIQLQYLVITYFKALFIQQQSLALARITLFFPNCDTKSKSYIVPWLSDTTCLHYTKLSKIPEAPAPYDLAGFNSFSARPNLAADTIFIDLVIFWMFFTDFNLTDTVIRERS